MISIATAEKTSHPRFSHLLHSLPNVSSPSVRARAISESRDRLAPEPELSSKSVTLCVFRSFGSGGTQLILAASSLKLQPWSTLGLSQGIRHRRLLSKRNSVYLSRFCLNLVPWSDGVSHYAIIICFCSSVSAQERWTQWRQGHASSLKLSTQARRNRHKHFPPTRVRHNPHGGTKGHSFKDSVSFWENAGTWVWARWGHAWFSC